MAGADTEMADSEKNVAEEFEESEQRRVRLNFTPVGRGWAEKMTSLLMTKYTDSIETVVEKLAFDAVGLFQQGLKRVYSTLRVVYPVAFSSTSKVGMLSNKEKCERYGDERESGPAEHPPGKTHRVARNTLRHHGSDKRSSTRH